MASEADSFSDDLTGFVLAGGASRRMGRDKARIPWEDGTLLTHAIEQMKCAASKVFVIGAVVPENLPVPVLPDKVPGLGPLAGIEAALSNSATHWNLVLAVDLPLVTPAMLKWISDLRTGAVERALIPRVKSRLQPLCAIYHRDLLPEIDKALSLQRSSIHRLLERLSTRIIEEDELIAAGFVPEMFLNVNSPEDLERARAMAKTKHG
ncbi:MAG: hypothetical protein DMG62_12780 [Acidobacteria bacterium]|nr:MAG: hypothetical protein DMG62_12780 [Acidobacteriota bacterium]